MEGEGVGVQEARLQEGAGGSGARHLLMEIPIHIRPGVVRPTAPVHHSMVVAGAVVARDTPVKTPASAP